MCSARLATTCPPDFRAPYTPFRLADPSATAEAGAGAREHAESEAVVDAARPPRREAPFLRPVSCQQSVCCAYSCGISLKLRTPPPAAESRNDQPRDLGPRDFSGCMAPSSRDSAPRRLCNGVPSSCYARSKITHFLVHLRHQGIRVSLDAQPDYQIACFVRPRGPPAASIP